MPQSIAAHVIPGATAADQVLPTQQIDLRNGTADRWLVESRDDGVVRATKRGGAPSGGDSNDPERHETTVSRVEGVAFPGFCDQERWESLRTNLKGALRPSDIVVSTYPKCGTTWSEQIVLLLLNAGDSSVLNPATKNSYNKEEGRPHGKIWLEAMIDAPPLGRGEFHRLAKADFRSIETRRLIKTHNPVRLLVGGDNLEAASPGGGPPCGGARIVYVSRNPKDACVSSYYHAFNPLESGWPFDAWASVWLTGNVGFGDWFAVTRDWHDLAQRWPDHVLFLHFEDIMANPAEAVGRIAKHIGIEADAERIDRVVEGSTFRAMATLGADRNGGKGVKHLRKGSVGDWRNHFSPALSTQFDAAYAARMRGTGLEYDLGNGEMLKSL